MGGGETRVAVFIADPEAEQTGTNRVLAPYRLTPAEVAVVERLVAGLSIGEAAEALDIALATARNHLQRAMAKTATRRQADLVRLVLASRVPVRG